MISSLFSKFRIKLSILFQRNPMLKFLPLLLVCIQFGHAQDYSGTWIWIHDGKHQSELSLEQVSSDEIHGSYCSVFFEGNKIDCPSSSEEQNISLQKISRNLYKGTIKSNYSGSDGIIKIRFRKRNRLKMTILEPPKAEYYLPLKAVFIRL